MMNQPGTLTALPPDLPSLSRNEITTLFLNTLTDVYNLKTHFLSYLPRIAEKASYQRLRVAILEAAMEVEAQKLRLNVIFRILKYELNRLPESLKGTIDIEGYIGANLQHLPSYKTDFVLFTHLIMMENMEITYYRVLRMLAASIKQSEIYELIKQCLQEALKTRNTYQLIGRMYKAEQTQRMVAN